MIKKNHAIELLRIISMLMIVAYHWQIHTCNDGIYKDALTSNQIFSFLVGSWGTLGVNIFFAISAFFLVKKNQIDMQKVFLLLAKVSIYGTIVVFIANALGFISLDIVTVTKSVLGVFAFQYWFISVYVILYILHPALNSIINTMSKKNMCTILFSTILATYFISFAFPGLILGRLACGLTIYLTIGFFEKYPECNLFAKYGKILTLILIPSIICLEIALSSFGEKYSPLFFSCIRRLQDTHSPIMFFSSLAFFYAFAVLTIKENAIILFLGKLSVGAYMIHGGASFIKDILWDNILNACFYYQTSLLTYGFHYLSSVFLIFIIGIFAEWIYLNTFEKFLKFILKRKFLIHH